MSSFLQTVACLLALASCGATQVTLGLAAPFAAIAGTTIVNTGDTTLAGFTGIFPGTAISGTISELLTGKIYTNEDTAQKALADAQIAFGLLENLPMTQSLTGQDLGNLPPLPPGVYNFASSGALTGTLRLDAQLNRTAQFIFQFGSTFIPAANAQVILLNGAKACNVFWQVGSSATLGANTQISGNIIASASITSGGGSIVQGGVYALNAQLSFNNNTITAPGSCTY
jgi:hypothetical protein